MATRQATLAETDRRAGDDGITCQVVLSAVPESPGETTCAAIRRDLNEFFDEIGESDRDADTVLTKDSPAGFNGTGTGTNDGVVYCYGDTTSSVLDDLAAVVEHATVTGLFATGLSSLGTDHTEIVASLDRIDDVLPDGTTLSLRGIGRTTIGSGEWLALRAAWAASADAAIARQRSACKRDIRRWANIEYAGGRPGLGFAVVDGELVPSPEYTEVCSVLEQVRGGEMSKNKAAAHLGTSPRTIRRCIEDCPDRYGL